MLLMTDSEECCVKTKSGYILLSSNIKKYNNGLGILCPWHANYDAKIISINYGDSVGALIVERWFAEKIAQKLGGEVIKLADAKPLASSSLSLLGKNQIRELEMLNVGFGDCFILSEENDGMLVDFGSKQKIPLRLVNEVENQIIAKNIHRCLLTHFHDDHYKGINELVKSNNIKNSFSEIVLPNLYFNKAAFKIQLFLLGLLKGTAWQDAYNFVTSTVKFDRLLRPNGVLHYVSKGAKFQIGRTEYTVLAPTLPDLKKLVNTGLSSYAEEIIEEYDTNNSMVQLYRQIIEAVSDIVQFGEVLQDNTSMQRRVEKKLSDGDAEKLLSDIERFSKLKWDISYDKQKRLKGMQQKFSTDWNKLSVVFKADDDSLLMTGDMTKKVWEHTVEPYCRNSIKVFKVPHHGTKNYFCWDFPNNAKYLISNGKCFNWHISALYPLHYRSAEFSCTNYKGCQYHLGMGSHCLSAKNCGCPSGSNAIVIHY